MHALNGILVRPARPSDWQGVAYVHEQSWGSSLSPLLPPGVLEYLAQGRRHQDIAALLQHPGQHQHMLVAECSRTVAGFVWFGAEPHELPPYQAQIHSLHVAPEFQRARIGTCLLRAAVRELCRTGIASLMLWVLKENRPARSFYERCGGVLLPIERPFVFRGVRYPSYRLLAYGWDGLPGQCLGPVSGDQGTR